jgi:4-carboxymuconolactone decarboxylase
MTAPERDLLDSQQPRIAPLREEEWTDEARELLVLAAGGDEPSPLNAFRTVARHPGLLRRFAPLLRELVENGALEPRIRELAILRTAWVCRSGYEWGHHVRMGKEAGLTPAEIEAVVAGADDPTWNAVESAVIRLVDELHHTVNVTDSTWSALSKGFDDAQLIELLLLVGAYTSFAYVLNALHVPLDRNNAAGLSAR